MRNAEELSTTTAPARTAAGAKRFDCAPPAENSAMSTPSRLCVGELLHRDIAAAEFHRLAGRARRGQQAQLRQREFALLEALHELDADGAGGAGDGDDGILLVTNGLGRSMTFFMAPNEKAPRVSSRGLRCSLSLSTQRAQDPKAPVGLVFVRLFDRGANHGGRNIAEWRPGVKRKAPDPALFARKFGQFYYRRTPWGVMRPLYQASINRMKSATDRPTRMVRARAIFFESPLPRDR